MPATTEEQLRLDQERAALYDEPSTVAGFGSEGKRLDYIDSLERDFAHGKSATPPGRRDEIATEIVKAGGADPRKAQR